MSAAAMLGMGQDREQWVQWVQWAGRVCKSSRTKAVSVIHVLGTGLVVGQVSVSLTFLDDWRLRDRLDPEGGSLRPWLLGIAINATRNTRNTRRAARRHAAAVARLPRDELMRDVADEVAGRVDDAAQLALVHTALEKLRRPEREVLSLRVVRPRLRGRRSGARGPGRHGTFPTLPSPEKARERR